MLTWAKHTLKKYDRAVKRIIRLYDFELDDDDNVRTIRRVVRAGKKKKGKRPKPKERMKYGIQVPKDIKEALEFDKNNENTLWQDAIDKEVNALLGLEVFDIREKGEKPSGHQRTTVHMIFDIKQDLRHKARLVAGGHLLELFDTEVYSSTVKGISVRLLHVIPHQNNLSVLCGDIGNAFPTAKTKEKAYFVANLEFGEQHKGKTVVLVKALYGLASSATAFHAHLADNLRSFGFVTTRFDPDVWIRLSEDKQTYEYICTHVDDFSIFARDPQPIMDLIKTKFEVKSEAPPPRVLLGK